MFVRNEFVLICFISIKRIPWSMYTVRSVQVKTINVHAFVGVKKYNAPPSTAMLSRTPPKKKTFLGTPYKEFIMISLYLIPSTIKSYQALTPLLDQTEHFCLRKMHVFL